MANVTPIKPKMELTRRPDNLEVRRGNRLTDTFNIDELPDLITEALKVLAR